MNLRNAAKTEDAIRRWDAVVRTQTPQRGRPSGCEPPADDRMKNLPENPRRTLRRPLAYRPDAGRAFFGGRPAETSSPGRNRRALSAKECETGTPVSKSGGTAGVVVAAQSLVPGNQPGRGFFS